MKGLMVQVAGVEVMVMAWLFLVFSLCKGSMQVLFWEPRGRAKGPSQPLHLCRAMQGWLPRGMHRVLRMTASGSVGDLGRVSSEGVSPLEKLRKHRVQARAPRSRRHSLICSPHFEGAQGGRPLS